MMNSDFNSRINLQAFCDANGVTGYRFVKLPRFGWFAINERDGEVRTLIDFIPTDKMIEFCTDLILEKKQYHECRILYNETAVTRLANDIRIMLSFKRFHREAQAEFMEGQVYASGKQVNLNKMFTDNGMAHLADTGAGYVTDTLFNTYRVALALHKKVQNSLVIPSWCSPQHICSFEHCRTDSPNRRTTFFINGEKGWYGKPTKFVHGNLANLFTNPGCTWDRKLNYWVETPLELAESLSVHQLLQIWTESRNIKFKRSPLDLIEAVNGINKLKYNVSELTLSQVEELETRFKLELTDYWRSQKQAEIKIGPITFIAKNMRYYAQLPDGDLQECTNFLMEINKIQKKDGVFYRQGIIYYEGKQEGFELSNDCFLTSRKFLQAINYFFLNRGIGIPLVNSCYTKYILEIVNRLNIGCMIDPSG